MAALLAAALLGPPAPAHAQAPDPAASGDSAAGSTPAKTTKVVDLANRYRFTERYARDDERETPAGAIGPYRMGLVEVTRETVDSPQGAPRKSETTRQTIFVERPAEQVGLGVVSGSVRSFERFRLRPEDPSRTMGARPLEGLTVYYRPKVGDLPLVLSLTEGRKLTEYEFDAITRQVFAPHMASILPPQPVRVGDSWRIPRRAAQAILGDVGIQGDTLIGKFAGLAKEVDGPRLVASVAISGRVTAASGETAVNAEALFTFTPEGRPRPDAPGAGPGRPADEVVEARGAITELRLARATGGPLPGPGRLRYQSSRELTVHRQLGLVANAPALPLPKLPASASAADDDARLTLIEPSGRFSFEHPQDLLPPDRAQLAPAVAGKVALLRVRREGMDLLQVELVPKPLGIEALKARLAAEYGKAAKMEIIQGAEEWLPEADWPRMKVYRIDAAAKVPDRAQGAPSAQPRTHFDAYLLLPGQAVSVIAIATTTRDAVAPFRREVEQILKSLQIDPARPKVE